jgi:hypothetical protein
VFMAGLKLCPSFDSLRSLSGEYEVPVRFAPRFATMQPPASEGGVPGVG